MSQITAFHYVQVFQQIKGIGNDDGITDMLSGDRYVRK